ncbi:MAG: SNF2 helicase associated domain-containing protein [Eubacteriales bacterium]|nr:SNF2 helicase associated domain-containing protein [Eubacteriales bacterium]
MKLNPLMISKETDNRRTYQRGQEYFRQAGTRIRSADIYENADGGWFVKAKIRGTSIYETQVDVDSDGELDNSYCSCPAWSEHPGLCKHCVALLLFAQEYMEKNNLLEKIEPQGQNECNTDLAAIQLLNAYMAEPEETSLINQIHLEPTLFLRPQFNASYLTFSIGQIHTYMVKSVYDLCKAFTQKQKISYGKFLSFVHTPSVLNDEGKKMLSFVLKYSLREGYVSTPQSEQRELHLSPAAFDELFDLYEGKSIAWSYEKELLKTYRSTTPLFVDRCVRRLDSLEEGETLPPDLNRIYFAANQPEIQLTIEAIPGGMQLSCYDTSLFSDGARLYLLKRNRLYRMDEKRSAVLAPLLKLFRGQSIAYSFSETDTVTFCSAVLPAIKPYVTILDKDGLLTRCLPEVMNAHLFLDAPRRDRVVGLAAAEYQNDIIELVNQQLLALSPEGAPMAIKGEVPSHRRDPQTERRFLQDVQRAFGCEENEALEMNGDDQIYAFLTEQLPALQAQATVHISDALKRYLTSTANKVQIGVRLESGLLKMDFDVDQFPVEELAAVLSAYHERRKYFRLKNGQFLQLDEGALGDVALLADGMQFTDKQLATGHIEAPAFRALYLDGLFREDNRKATLRRDPAFKALVRSVRNAADSDYEAPPAMQNILRAYQETGYRWLRTLEECGLCGILADDMGLGKTVQIIAVLYARQKEHLPPSLIVCPASLVLNWKAEFDKFAPELCVKAVVGTASVREAIIASTQQGDILVTSYDLLRRDEMLYRGMQFHYCIIDEAQYIKNHVTKNAQAVKNIASVQRFALTGTPVENRLSELWSIFDFLMPGYLFNYNRFRQRFELPIVKNKDENSRAQLRRMIAPFLLRRLKKDVLTELPPKETTIVPVELSEEQHKVYLAASITGLQKLRSGSGDSNPGERKLQVLALLTRLRQLCCDPSLCFEDYKGGSAKLEACMELVLQAQSGGHKVLLFSQFTSMLAILEKRLKEEGVSYDLLQGSTPRDKRLEMAERFNENDTTVFLISLKAGGTGLNLTGADVVIHYDPWWNLAAQEQATDRAYRIGQTRHLQVYKLIAAETIEEKIIKLQEMKGDLASIIEGEDGGSAGMSAEELMKLLEERQEDALSPEQ